MVSSASPELPSLKRASRALVLFLGLVAFYPALRIGFQLDDHTNIVQNDSLHSLNLQALKQDFFPTKPTQGEMYYRPLQSLTHRLQYLFFGTRPLGYHLLNLLVHLGNALLVVELIIALGFSLWCALAVGCLFAVHPLIVSELMMASGIPELLCLFFSLASLLLLLRKQVIYGWIGLAVYGLALLTKESAIAVPFYFALVSGGTLAKEERIRRGVALVLLTVAYGYLRYAILGTSGSIPLDLGVLYFLGTRFPAILLQYTGLTLFPWHLHAYRLIPAVSPFWVYGIGLLLVADYWRNGKPAWAKLTFAWVFISLLPKIPLMSGGYYMLEHWIYPGLIGLLLPIGIFLDRGWRHSKPAIRAAATVGFAVLLCFWIFSARFHLIVRATDEKNYRWSLQFTRATPLLFNLGLICLQTGRAEEAVQYIQPVHDLFPEDVGIANALAVAKQQAVRKS